MKTYCGLVGSLVLAATSLIILGGLGGCANPALGTGPVALFSMTPSAGTAPLDVTFSDLSTGGPANWLWSFGDGYTSTVPNPSHLYSSTGRYLVRLQVSDETSFGVAEQVLNVHLQRALFPMGAAFGTDSIVIEVDGDGVPDVVAVSRSLGSVAWWTSDAGAGTPGPRNEIETGLAGVALVASGYMDGDATEDVLIASPATGMVAVYMSHGDGTFAARVELDASFSNVGGIAVADLDANGSVDVVAVSDSLGQLVWWSNDGTGTFGPRAILQAGLGGPSSLSIHDFDGDGDLDIVVAESSGGDLTCLVNDGTGSYTLKKTIQAGLEGVNRVLGTDVDADGDVDVVGAASGDGSLAWWVNDGVGNFSAANGIARSVGSIADLGVFDVDGDGSLEVLAACQERNQVAYFQRYVTPGSDEIWLEENIDADVDQGESVCGIVLPSGHRCFVGGGGTGALTLWSR